MISAGIYLENHIDVYVIAYGTLIAVRYQMQVTEPLSDCVLVPTGAGQ